MGSEARHFFDIKMSHNYRDDAELAGRLQEFSARRSGLKIASDKSSYVALKRCLHFEY